MSNHLQVENEKVFYNDLLKYANTLKLIDAHKHLLSAEYHYKINLSFWNFLSAYFKWDLMGAGLPKKYENYMPINEQEVIELFNTVEPYLPESTCADSTPGVELMGASINRKY